MAGLTARAALINPCRLPDAQYAFLTASLQSVQDVFSLRRPKDFKAGLSSGSKSIVKGIGAGVVGLVAAPVLGAHQQGFAGFAKGAAAGPVKPHVTFLFTCFTYFCAN